MAIGLAVDLTYSAKIGLIKVSTERCLRLLEKLGFRLFDELLVSLSENQTEVILTDSKISGALGRRADHHFAAGIGEGVEVHAMDKEKILESVDDLREGDCPGQNLGNELRGGEQCPRAVVLSVVGLCRGTGLARPASLHWRARKRRGRLISTHFLP